MWIALQFSFFNRPGRERSSLFFSFNPFSGCCDVAVEREMLFRCESIQKIAICENIDYQKEMQFIWQRNEDERNTLFPTRIQYSLLNPIISKKKWKKRTNKSKERFNRGKSVILSRRHLFLYHGANNLIYGYYHLSIT